MEVIYEVLMVDDDINNFLTLSNRARKRNIILKYAKSKEGAEQELIGNRKIAAVIIDGKGFLKEDQVRGSEKTNFVFQTMTMLNEIEIREERRIPKVVLTAFDNELKESLESSVKVFSKSEVSLNDKDFFDYIIDEIKNNLNYKIRTTYIDLFNTVNDEIFNKTYPNADSKLFELITEYESKKQVKDKFNLMRLLLEEIFLALNNLNKELIPDNLINIQNNLPDQNRCIAYIKGIPVLKDYNKDFNDPSNHLYKALPKNEKNIYPDYIIHCFDYVKKLTNILSHPNSKPYSENLFNSGCLSLFEILKWINKKL